ncbi:Flp pilus assembly protein CpaB [Thioclava nitratireducens]|uniref:Flp pilus assembly protein CpaB n=1 Tax=Thioclava nitratireducens TaxID=1915078 RepID=A0ABN4X7A5_9RHOB|nr:Flp pilus assembly protein CpaB [Thioclava nitratireducens]AQS46980.1 Flp pilus assembly protein CpaB [Thioclava nitratireducens]
MRLIFVLFLVAGVGLAGVAVMMAQGQISQFQAERDQLAAMQKNAPKLGDVVIARHPMKYGEHFNAEDLAVIKMQANAIPPTAFRTVIAKAGTPEAEHAVFLEGETKSRASMRTVTGREVILADRVTQPGENAGIMASLADGRRAFTIQVSSTSAVSGFLRPGDFVDVYWSGSINGEPVTKLIDSNLKLIAIDQSTDPDRTSATQIARSVTAEVSPEQVAALTLAQNTGRLTLSLVGLENSAQLGQIEINRDELLGIKKEEVKQVEKAQVCTIKTRKGTEVIETPIPCTN